MGFAVQSLAAPESTRIGMIKKFLQSRHNEDDETSIEANIELVLQRADVHARVRERYDNKLYSLVVAVSSESLCKV